VNKNLIILILNSIAMIFLIISRDEFDWFAIIALIALLISLGSIVYILKKTDSK